MSLYTLKPRFQALLRPSVRVLHALGVTANQVTIAACAGSVMVGSGLVIAAESEQRQWFLLLPAWLLLRMAMNAMDGLMAREFGQRSAIGAYLNELCDLLSDAALYLPVAFVPGAGEVLTMQLVAADQIGVADADAGNAHQHLVIAQFRQFHFGYFEAATFVVDDGSPGLHRLSPSSCRMAAGLSGSASSRCRVHASARSGGR